MVSAASPVEPAMPIRAGRDADDPAGGVEGVGRLDEAAEGVDGGGAQADLDHGGVGEGGGHRRVEAHDVQRARVGKEGRPQGQPRGAPSRRIVLTVAPADVEERDGANVGALRPHPGRDVHAPQHNAHVPAVTHEPHGPAVLHRPGRLRRAAGGEAAAEEQADGHDPGRAHAGLRAGHGRPPPAPAATPAPSRRARSGTRRSRRSWRCPGASPRPAGAPGGGRRARCP